MPRTNHPQRGGLEGGTPSVPACALEAPVNGVREPELSREHWTYQIVFCRHVSVHVIYCLRDSTATLGWFPHPHFADWENEAQEKAMLARLISNQGARHRMPAAWLQCENLI